MAKIAGYPTIADLDLYSSYTVVPSGISLGQRFPGQNGKEFVFCLAGASNLVVGNLLQSPAIDTQFNDMAVPAAIAAGESTVTITNGTTSVTANQYVGGSLQVSVAPGLGEEYTILGHGLATSGTAWVLQLDRPLRTAWNTSTKATVRRSAYSGVIQFPATTQTGIPVGVAIYAIPAGEYGFIQVKGECAVLSDGSTFAVGSNVGSVSGTAGCVTVYDAATTLACVGIARNAAASGKTINVMLQL